MVLFFMNRVASHWLIASGFCTIEHHRIKCRLHDKLPSNLYKPLSLYLFPHPSKNDAWAPGALSSPMKYYSDNDL